jgi:hypothetical protein
MVRSLTMIREDLSARHGELLPVLLKAGQHCEIALIRYRTAVPLDVAGACTLLLIRSSVLPHRGTGEEKRQGADDKDIVFHENLCAMMTLFTAGPLGQGPRGIEISRDGERSGSDHHQIDASVFEAFPRQTIPRHLFDPVPVLTKISRSLVLGRKCGPQTAGLAHISVCDLKKHRLLSLFRFRLCSRPIAHRLFLCEHWQS